MGTFLLMIGLIACGEDDKTDNTDSGSSSDEGTDTTDTEPTESDVNPTILETDAWCYIAEVGDAVEQWIFKAIANDPQGAETLASFTPDAISFQDVGGTEISKLAIVCSPTGECTTSATSTTLGVGCSAPTNFQAVITVADEDGNLSAPVTVPGRAGSSASGK